MADTVKVPHPSEYIREEMMARGWQLEDVAVRMGHEFAWNMLALGLYLQVKDPRLLIGENTAAALGRVFDVSPELFLNLESAWLASLPTEPEVAASVEGEGHG